MGSNIRARVEELRQRSLALIAQPDTTHTVIIVTPPGGFEHRRPTTARKENQS